MISPDKWKAEMIEAVRILFMKGKVSVDEAGKLIASVNKPIKNVR